MRQKAVVYPVPRESEDQVNVSHGHECDRSTALSTNSLGALFGPMEV